MKLSIRLFAILTLILVSAHGRTWTSTDGRTIEADFLRLKGELVVVNRAGRTLKIPLAKLSEADRKWVADQAPKPAPAAAKPADPKRISEILEACFKAVPSDAERAEVVAFFTSLLPTKGADDEELDWKVAMPVWDANQPQDSILISADMYPKGNEEDRLMWFHIVYEAEEKEVFGNEKLGRYPALRAKDRHCFVTVKRTDVRGVADAESYEDGKKIDAVIEAIDLRTIAKL